MSHYFVEFTGRATDEFHAICNWYKRQSVQAAKKWIDVEGRIIDQLECDPLRFPRSREKKVFSLHLQECFFGAGRQLTHRFVFSVHPDSKVVVYTIRHLAHSELTEGEL